MTGPFRFTTPSTTAVGSSNGANAPTFSIASVPEGSLLVFGLDAGFGTSGSRQSLRIEAGGVPIWSCIVPDYGTFDFRNPLEASKATSLQVIAPAPGGTADARISLRYATERT